jgi:hypothetical protein
VLRKHIVANENANLHLETLCGYNLESKHDDPKGGGRMGTAARWAGLCPTRARPYGVGVRVLTDRPLLKQIRAEIARNAMKVEEIAVLENVSAAELIQLLEQFFGGETRSGQQLREFALSHPGFGVAAWRTSRKHVSKLHLLNAEGILPCGTSPGSERSPVHSGTCVTCAVYAGLDSRWHESVDQPAPERLGHCGGASSDAEPLIEAVQPGLDGRRG